MENGTKIKPTKDQVLQWVKADLRSAHYFLGMLMRYPEILDSCAQQIYDHAMMKEGGAAIDQVDKNETKLDLKDAD